MWSASSLVRHCAHVNVLKRVKPKSVSTQQACDRGTEFHAAVEAWIRTGAVPELADLEMQGWLDLLASQWTPPPGTDTEIPWGLDVYGNHVEVNEPEPHVYVAAGGADLLTAGRGDAAWLADVIEEDSGYVGSDVVHFLDWKTGKWPAPPARENLQVNAGGIALARKFGARAWRPGIYYARDGVFDWGDVVEIGSIAHVEMYADVRASALLPETPIPGDHCGNCWERRNCASADAAVPDASDPF